MAGRSWLSPADWRIEDSARMGSARMDGTALHAGMDARYTGSKARWPAGPVLEEGELRTHDEECTHDDDGARAFTPAPFASPSPHMPMHTSRLATFSGRIQELRAKQAEARNARGDCALHTPAVLFPTGSSMHIPLTPPRMTKSNKANPTPPKGPNTDANPRRETEDEDEEQQQQESDRPGTSAQMQQPRTPAAPRTHPLAETAHTATTKRLEGTLTKALEKIKSLEAESAVANTRQRDTEDTVAEVRTDSIPFPPELDAMLDRIALDVLCHVPSHHAAFLKQHPVVPRLPARVRAAFEEAASHSHPHPHVVPAAPQVVTKVNEALPNQLATLGQRSNTLEATLRTFEQQLQQHSPAFSPEMVERACSSLMAMAEAILKQHSQRTAADDQQLAAEMQQQENERASAAERTAADEAEQEKERTRARLTEQLRQLDGGTGNPPPPPPQQVCSSVDLSKVMQKPVPFAGRADQDVDSAILRFETYLTYTRAPKQAWPLIASEFLRDDAHNTWMSKWLPMHRNNQAPTWEDFTECLTTAYASPDKEIAARKQLKNLRQQHRTPMEYVRHANHLLSQIVHDKPTESDKLRALFDGLHNDLKNDIPLHPSGRRWQTYKELADHLTHLEIELPQKFKKPSLDFSRKPARAFAASAKPTPRPPTPARPPSQDRRQLPRFDNRGGGGGGRRFNEASASRSSGFRGSSPSRGDDRSSKQPRVDVDGLLRENAELRRNQQQKY